VLNRKHCRGKNNKIKATGISLLLFIPHLFRKKVRDLLPLNLFSAKLLK